MNSILIVFASLTSANRVRSVLQKMNIGSEIIQTPSGFAYKSCSYSLRIMENNLDTVWKIVSDSGLSSKGAYRESDMTKLK